MLWGFVASWAPTRHPPRECCPPHSCLCPLRVPPSGQVPQVCSQPAEAMGHPAPWARGPVPSQLQPLCCWGRVVMLGRVGRDGGGCAEALGVPSRPCWCADFMSVDSRNSHHQAPEVSPGLRCPPGPGDLPRALQRPG